MHSSLTNQNAKAQGPQMIRPRWPVLQPMGPLGPTPQPLQESGVIQSTSAPAAQAWVLQIISLLPLLSQASAAAPNGSEQAAGDRPSRPREEVVGRAGRRC